MATPVTIVHKELWRVIHTLARPFLSLLFAVPFIAPVVMSSSVANAAWMVEEAVTPFDFSVQKEAQITPVKQVSRSWRLCALYPHLKDSYWLSVNYGMVDQARKLGIDLKVLAADGYVDASRQEAQLDVCQAWKADAILLGGVGYNLLEQKVALLSQDIPVFGLVNNISPKGVTGKVGVDWYQMGFRVGRVLAKRHPKESQRVTAAWFSSPTGRGGSDVSLRGLRDALHNSSVVVVKESYGDNDHAVKRDLIQKVLEQYPDVNYLIGGAVMTEVAIGELKRRRLTDKVKLVSTYLSHGVYRGLLRNKIDLANDDHMVLQGRLSVDQAVKYLEGKAWVQDLGPGIVELCPALINQGLDMTQSLSPANWRPVYEVVQKTSSVNK
ncbi:TMAO reductase system periplasmic protein TorT [Sansalvadorimonas sp. 2012CJ34-2]|uniref:TMAO reductase system periplasmic protein TorT n=1 Tax=Parendozoicomonas callyspongiae TaxID=2942213 RepID=A0ABT0PEX8_9GAMM|nr:TMAO reductase system periplasmic protein TorT [Sansalvadorimonas sp. 2012CJ34-2]MCL6269925.1 TMAO reductase system periplasmic protein TorT [Sansalvadorimonas sp. 2012CJ34-2]